jgi:hypothetical protein
MPRSVRLGPYGVGVKLRRVLIGGLSLLVAVVLFYAAFVWWTVNGISVIDSPEGEPSDPLNGYGVLALLVVGGLSALVLGVRHLRRIDAASE